MCVAWGVEKVIYLSLHCRHHSNSCIKIGTDESHFTVPLIVGGTSQKTVSTNYDLSKKF